MKPSDVMLELKRRAARDHPAKRSACQPCAVSREPMDHTLQLAAWSLAAMTLLGGCGGSGPALQAVGDPTGGVVEFSVGAEQPWIFGALTLCLSAPGQVTVTSVTIHPGPWPVGGLHVEAFATRPNPWTHLAPPLGAQPSTLAAFGHGFVVGGAQQVVETSSCPTQAELDTNTWRGGTELGVQVAKDLPGTGAGDGLDITYTSAGSSHSMVIHFAIVLCAAQLPSECPLSSAGGGGRMPLPTASRSASP
jgi:hypothetical protein